MGLSKDAAQNEKARRRKAPGPEIRPVRSVTAYNW
jgi:hypothetical protein